MGDAVGLMLWLPLEYFGALLHPDALQILWIPLAIGSLCLGVGLFLGYKSREKRLLLFAISPLFSEILVVSSIFMQGKLAAAVSPLLGGFVILQIGLLAYLVHRATTRRAAIALAIFAVSYAIVAALHAAMSFTNTWL